jgi:hypothetical protein
MSNVRLPLSGNVTQSINPWNWVFNPTGSQFGVVNVNLGRSSDPQVEERILEDVGSYGKQLGKIGDVLRILLAHATLANLTPQEKAAIDDLRGQLDAIDEIKAQSSRVAGRRTSQSIITAT